MVSFIISHTYYIDCDYIYNYLITFANISLPTSRTNKLPFDVSLRQIIATDYFLVCDVDARFIRQ